MTKKKRHSFRKKVRLEKEGGGKPPFPTDVRASFDQLRTLRIDSQERGLTPADFRELNRKP
jgi:hypothetical protein